MASRIVAFAWLGGRQTIGVIITHDPDNGSKPFKARIGAVSGESIDNDFKYLMEQGNKISLLPAHYIVRLHGAWADKKAQAIFIDVLLEKLKEAS